MNGRTPGGGNGGGAGPPELPARRKAGGQSKYDYVKVRVWLAPEGPGLPGGLSMCEVADLHENL